MKSILSILTGLILVSSIQAIACPNRTADKLLCPGDTVYPYDFIRGSGSVIGVNPVQRKVSVRDDLNGSTVYNYQINQVAIGTGCFENYCVGDKVFGNDFIRGDGRIVGVNPYTRSVVVRDNLNGSTLYNYKIDQIGVGFGCLDGFCVGDTVIADDFVRGSGTVVGVNPFSRRLFVRDNLNGSTLYQYTSDRLTTSAYCAEYGNYSRSIPTFPLLNDQDYLIPELKFREQRRN